MQITISNSLPGLCIYFLIKKVWDNRDYWLISSGSKLREVISMDSWAQMPTTGKARVLGCTWEPACLALPPITGTVSGSEDTPSVLMLWVCGCHMGRGGVTDLAMALPWISASCKDCQVTAGIFGCHSGPGSVCCSRHPAGFVGERLVRFAFLLLGVLAGNTQQVGGGSSMTLGLKMIIFCTWKLHMASPSEVFCCPVPSGSPTNNQLQVPIPSCAAGAKYLISLSHGFLTGKKERKGWEK